ncbi:MAG: flagellar protein export ATPase FliI [Parvibaculaceae bacterium]
MTAALQALAQVAAEASEPLAGVRIGGRVTEITRAYWRVRGLSAFVKLGDCVSIETRNGSELGEIVRIDDQGATVKPYHAGAETGLGMPVWRVGRVTIAPQDGWRGRVVDALGRPIDGGASLPGGEDARSIEAPPPSALKRKPVRKAVKTGIRVMDIFTPLCAGQRVGIFAGSGIGKTTLLAMLAHSGGFDTVVVGLVGERGREVRDFIEEAMGGDLSRTVLVVATSDESPMMRRLAPKTAMTIAEYFRDKGEEVLLILDSVTRYAHACRDVALAAGEPPVARGYAPSVFTDLPKLLERAGPGEDGSGSITGIFSVLVDGDDHNDPVADNVRGTLDGHIVLDRAIAEQGRYPAVNMLASVSRLAQHVWTAEQRTLVMKLKGLVSRFEDTRDLRLMGGYQPGADTELDQAVQLVPKIYNAMKQGPGAAGGEFGFRELAEALSA